MHENLCKQDSARVLNSSFIKQNVPMVRAIGLMENAFQLLSDKTAFVPERVVMTTPDDTISIFFKPAFMSRFHRMSVKILTQIHGNNNPQIPTIKGMVLLVDMISGHILSISDGISITALRTGAASGIATSYLANPDASSVAIFGCGAQGRTQLEAVRAVRNIKRISLFDLCLNQALSLAKEVGSTSDITCEINPDLSVLKRMDIICTATPSQKPLFTLSQLKPGVHINAVGSYRPDMQEIEPKIFGIGLTYLDDAPACLKDSGDLVIPLNAGIITLEDIVGELGELISGSIAGRQKEDDITIFKSVGNAIQDFFIANEAYERSLLRDDTREINLYD